MRAALLLACLLALASLSPAVAGRGPLPTSCSGSVNNLPVTHFDLGNSKPLRVVENGTLYSVMPANASTPLLVLHVSGSSYAQGVAYGALLSNEIQQLIPLAYDFFTQKYGLPHDLVKDLLDITRNTTLPFTPPHHLEFLQGVSDGTQGAVEYEEFWRVSLIPELTKAACSITGAWGGATSSGDLIQLRALDWSTDGPFQQWPLLATFHPDDGSFAYSTLGFVGLYGTLTGWSSSGMAVSEKFWAEYDKLDNIYGYPWPWLLQDVLRYDSDVDEAMSRVATAVRTCAMWFGFGQAARTNPRNPQGENLPANFKLLQYSFEKVSFFNPENFPTYKDHDYFPDLLFVDKHVQPSHDPCMNDLFHWSYGSLTADDFRSTITALAKTGDMHIGIFDASAQTVFVANAAPMPNNSPAYNNGFVSFDMKSMWAPQTAASAEHKPRARIVLA